MLRRHPQLLARTLSGAKLLRLAGLLGLALLTSLAAGCGSMGSDSNSSSAPEDGMPARVTFVDYRGPVRMNLVNQAHTDPVEYYSEKRATANTKITTNVVMKAMLEHFDDEGFNRWAQSGYAPSRGGAGALQALEIETPAGVVFLVNGEGVDPLARQSFRECRKAFMQIQEITVQAQAIDNASGNNVFGNLDSKRGEN